MAADSDQEALAADANLNKALCMSKNHVIPLEHLMLLLCVQ